MPTWFMMGEEKGQRAFLINLDVTLGIYKGDDGNALAVGVAGATVPLGVPFEMVVDDLTSEAVEEMQ